MGWGLGSNWGLEEGSPTHCLLQNPAAGMWKPHNQKTNKLLKAACEVAKSCVHPTTQLVVCTA